MTLYPSPRTFNPQATCKLFLRMYNLLCKSSPVLKECTQPTAVTYFVDEILTNMDKGLVTAGTVFFDLAKSFDTVDHEILLSKLEYYGVCDESLPWFKNYFSGRKQSVHIDSQSTVGSISAVSRVRSLIRPEERRLDA